MKALIASALILASLTACSTKPSISTKVAVVRQLNDTTKKQALVPSWAVVGDTIRTNRDYTYTQYDGPGTWKVVVVAFPTK